MNLRLTSIQRFCTKDGPGIRTALFSKGCSVRCPWCANPENLCYEKQYYLSKKCLKSKCDNTECKYFGNIDYAVVDEGTCCEYGGIGIFGEDYSVENVAKICFKDKAYYGHDGGITATGGEALLQAVAFANLFEIMKANNVSCCLETSLYAPTENLTYLLPFLDYIYVDFKILIPNEAERILKADFSLFETNLEYLFSAFDRKKVCVRVPLAKGYTTTEDNLEVIKNKLREYKPSLCEIFNVHLLGEAKYRLLNMKMRHFEILCEQELNELRNQIEEATSVNTVVNMI